jgi:hypothetical protein
MCRRRRVLLLLKRSVGVKRRPTVRVLLLPRHSAGVRRSPSVRVLLLLRLRGASRRRPHVHRQQRRLAGSSRYVLTQCLQTRGTQKNVSFKQG